jgi:hypothetical protein
MRDYARLVLDERYLDHLAPELSGSDLELPEWKELPGWEMGEQLEPWVDGEERVINRTARREAGDLFEDSREFADWDS